MSARDGSGARLPVPRQLPPDVAHFTDREPYLDRLHAWLDLPGEQAPPAEIIAGIGGVGKTSLAAHWAHQVRERFPDGDLFLDLRGYHAERSVSAEEALDQMLRAFDIAPERIPVGVDAMAALYRSLLYGRQILIVLDNASAPEQVRPLLPGCTTCRVLVTSRSRLAGLTARNGAHRMSLDVLQPERALELLKQIAGEERARDEPAEMAELARYCAYLPLALRIAAERLVASSYLSVADLVGELAEVRDRLDVLAAEDDEITAVRVVFSWSYRALSPDAARMYRLLGLPTGLDISAAAAAALAGVPETKARRLLGELTSAHMLEENGPKRFRLHDLLRVHAAECAEQDEPDRNSAVSRLITWYVHSVVSAAKVIDPHFSTIPMNLADPVNEPARFPDRPTALEWCDGERANLVAAVSQAAEIEDHALACQLPVALFGYLLARRPLKDWVTTHAVGVASARRSGARSAEAWLLTSKAIAHRELRQYDAALADLEEAVPAWDEAGPDWGEKWARRDIGIMYHTVGRDTEAVEMLGQVIDMHRADGDAWAESTALSWLAKAHHALGQYAEALEEAHAALDIRRQENDQRNIGSALSELSLIHLSAGDTEQAIDYAEQALVILEAVDFRPGQARTHERLGDALTSAGRTADAQAHWIAAVELYESVGDPRAADVQARLTSIG